MLDARVHQRLAKVLALLASEHDGERASAALVASRIVSAAGLAWNDVLAPPAAECAVVDGGWRTAALRLLATAGPRLNDFEREFLRGIGRFRVLSPRQAATLQAITVKVRGTPETRAGR